MFHGLVEKRCHISRQSKIACTYLTNKKQIKTIYRQWPLSVEPMGMLIFDFQKN